MKKIICVDVEFALNNGTETVTDMYESIDEIVKYNGNNACRKKLMSLRIVSKFCEVAGFVEMVGSEPDKMLFIQIIDDIDSYKIVEQ